MLYIGCPMWGYKDWVGPGRLFPPRTPASDFLRLYSRKLTTVEGNTTFYSIPSQETIARWAQETPQTFRFCPKIARSISHEPGLGEKRAATLAFVERMRGLGTRLGPIFLQLPPTFTPAQIPELETWLHDWPTDVRLAVEVRHPGFFASPHRETLDHLLNQHRVARIIMDTRPLQVGTPEEQQVLQARERKPHLPVQIALTSDFGFIRYIGHPHMEKNKPFLAEWAEQLGQWLAQGITLYVFCHCPNEEHSPDICVSLYQRVRNLVPLPPLAWEPARQDTQEQLRLF